jgi:2'-5' RNA ligase
MANALWRLFIAVELSDEVRAALGAVSRALQRQVPDGLRWVAPEATHLTLKFLGETPSERVNAIVEAMRRAAATVPPFDLSLNGVGAFPNGRAPRVVWVDLAEGAEEATKLAGALERALLPLGFPPEGRPFSAHLTLARTRDGMRPDERERLAAALQRRVEVPQAGMRVEAISLMRSELRPEGPRYTRVGEARLEATA